MNEIQVTANLDKNEKACMIIEEEMNTTIKINIEINCMYINEDEVAAAVEEEIFDIGTLADDCKEKIKEIKKRHKEIMGMMSHEVDELGEKHGLWKAPEVQKRLV